MKKIEIVSILMVLVFGPALIITFWNDFISPVPYYDLYKWSAIILGLMFVPIILGLSEK